MNCKNLTKEFVCDLFDYDDGVLVWKINSGANKLAGKIAGWKHKNGYRCVKISRKEFKVHRIIFLMHYGYLPEMVDHIDRNIENNRIENLRAATRSENGMNQKIRSDNSSGAKGVVWNDSCNKWAVTCQIKNKRMYFGVYEDLELASLVAEEARNKHHGEFARHN